MGSKKHYGNCYLCGEYDKLTKDHVPPECFAPLPLQPFTQTSTSRFRHAWACAQCNEYYGKREKSFKNLMLTHRSLKLRAVLKNCSLKRSVCVQLDINRASLGQKSLTLSSSMFTKWGKNTDL